MVRLELGPLRTVDWSPAIMVAGDQKLADQTQASSTATRERETVYNNPCFKMDVEGIVAVALWIQKKKKLKKKNKYWVHPLLQERRSKGLFNIFFSDLRQYEHKFFNYVRMSVKSFDEMLDVLRPLIAGQDTNMRPCITPEEKLLVTLR